MTPEELSDMYNAPALPFDPVTGQATHQEPQPYPYPPGREPAPYPDPHSDFDLRDQIREEEQARERRVQREHEDMLQAAAEQDRLARERQKYALAAQDMRHESRMLQIRQAAIPEAMAANWSAQRTFLVGVLAGAAIAGLVFWSRARK